MKKILLFVYCLFIVFSSYTQTQSWKRTQAYDQYSETGIFKTNGSAKNTNIQERSFQPEGAVPKILAAKNDTIILKQFNITGYAISSTSHDTLKSGSIRLFALVDSLHASLIESVMIGMDGSYKFVEPDSNYLVQVIPDTSLYPGLIPTYYGNRSTWREASIIRPSVSLPPYNIICNSLSPLKGQGIIRGLITSQLVNLKVAPRPIKGFAVFLVEKGMEGDSLIAFTLSNDTGFYQFTNVPDGAFFILVDLIGINQVDTQFVTLTPEVKLIDNVNYAVNSDGIIKMNFVTTIMTNSINIVIYPNPSSGIFTIEFNGIKNSNSIFIYDLTGKKIISVQNSDNENLINLESFAKGIYLLRVTTEQGTLNSKLVKE